MKRNYRIIETWQSVALALLLCARIAHAGVFVTYVDAASLHPSQALPPCVPDTEGDKDILRCSPTFGFWAPIPIPGGITAICVGGSNPGAACTVNANCTGGGSCHTFCGVDVHLHVASSDTTKAVCMQAGWEASPVGGDWVANDGRDGGIVKNSTGVSAVPGSELVVHIPLVQAFNQFTGNDCLPGGCDNAQGVLAIDRPDSSFCINDLALVDAIVEGVFIQCPVP